MSVRSDGGQSTAFFLAAMAAIVVLSGLLGYGAYAAYDISGLAASTANANAAIDAHTLPLEQLPHGNKVTAEILHTSHRIADNLQLVLNRSQRGAQLSGDVMQATRANRDLIARADGLASAILGLNTHIQHTSAGIQDVSASILTVNRRVRRDIAAVNAHLARTIQIAHAIAADTGNIEGQTHRTLHLNACIDREAHGPGYMPPECRGTGGTATTSAERAAERKGAQR